MNSPRSAGARTAMPTTINPNQRHDCITTVGALVIARQISRSIDRRGGRMRDIRETRHLLERVGGFLLPA